ncbi:MAG: glycosyltransferase [Acidobacteria bacterium]|nr:glycosyltransferase [Acidobacteriota bacterium]
MRSLSVVVIGRNEETYITDCLRSVLTAIAQVGSAEVVYVDSASTDRTVELARALGVRVILLRPEWELSPSAGRYVGFHHTSSELIMFVDGDTVIEPDWLRYAIPWFDRPEVTGVAGFFVDLDDRGRLLPYVGKRSETVCEMGELRGSGLYRRRAMEQVGTFNPYLVTDEEAELGLRLQREGWKLLHLPYPMARHLRSAPRLKMMLRAFRLGRICRIGVTFRYACREGLGFQFCFRHLRLTMIFALACLLLSPGLFLLLTGYSHAAKLFLWPLLLGNVAIAIKKRSLLGPLDYIVTHGLALFGLIAGSLKVQIKDPRDYPLDVIEIADHEIQIGALNLLDL